MLNLGFLIILEHSLMIDELVLQSLQAFPLFLVLMEFVLKRKKLPQVKAVILLFALFFSFACAGLWEVYEFSTDQLIGTSMQGDAFDTMTDIISGVLGGLVYFVLVAAIKKEPHDNP